MLTSDSITFKGILDERNRDVYGYSEGAILNGISVDFSILSTPDLDGSQREGGLVYVSSGDNLTQEQANQTSLESAGFTVLYIAMFPSPSPDGSYTLDLVTPQVESFLDCLDNGLLYPCF